jgi:Leucine-rich repeat (LRR) protein
MVRFNSQQHYTLSATQGKKATKPPHTKHETKTQNAKSNSTLTQLAGLVLDSFDFILSFEFRRWHHYPLYRPSAAGCNNGSYLRERRLSTITMTENGKAMEPHSDADDEKRDEQEQQVQHLIQLSGLSRNDFSVLTKLNLPNCGLSTLPSCLPQVLPNLSVLFMPKNQFQVLPKVIGDCLELQMVSFKDNGMVSIHPEALQPQLRWLILTGNSIQALPETIGRCTSLQKLMLSGNQLKELPDSVSLLKNLELVRLACNRLQEVRRIYYRVDKVWGLPRIQSHMYPCSHASLLCKKYCSLP